MSLDVSICDCHTPSMAAERYTSADLTRIGRAVERERLDRNWGKEAAARIAGINSITWKRVEDGLSVRGTSLRAVEKALEWEAGTIEEVAATGVPPTATEPVAEPAAESTPRRDTLESDRTELLDRSAREAMSIRSIGYELLDRITAPESYVEVTAGLIQISKDRADVLFHAVELDTTLRPVYAEAYAEAMIAVRQFTVLHNRTARPGQRYDIESDRSRSPDAEDGELLGLRLRGNATGDHREESGNRLSFGS